MRATFEADNGARFVFYTERCSEMVRTVCADGREVVMPLEAFVRVIRRVCRERREAFKRVLPGGPAPVSP